jgi:hypothetical protein
MFCYVGVAIFEVHCIKYIDHSSHIQVHKINQYKCVHPSIPNGIISSFNHVIVLFQIWSMLQCYIMTNIITIMGERCVVTLTSISNPKFGVVNSWALSSWQRFKTFKWTKKNCKIHITKYPQNKFLEILAIYDLEVLLILFSFGITMGKISC